MTLHTWPCSHCNKRRNGPCGSPCIGNDRLERAEMRRQQIDARYVPENES